MIGKYNEEIPSGHHTITVSTTFPLLVSIDGVPERALAPGNHKVTVKTEGTHTLEIDPTEAKKPYKFEVKTYETTRYDINNDLPPPQPPAPDNYIQMLKQKVREQMGNPREAFADQISIYEAGNVDEFEETQYENAKAAALADEAKDGEPDSDPMIETPASNPGTAEQSSS